MSLGFEIKKERDENPEASHSSEQEPTTPELPPTGASIDPETVKLEVEIARIVEPEIAKVAQEGLDKEKEQNEQDELKAQEHLKEQEAHKSAAQKLHEASLAAAKDKLRAHTVVNPEGKEEKITETPQEHEQRIKDEEKARLTAEHAAKFVQAQLAEEAVAAIKPQLDGIQSVAQEALDKRAQALAALAEKAQEHRQENEEHRLKVEHKAQADLEKQHADDHMFTHGDGKDHGVKPSASSHQVEKLMALQAELAKDEKPSVIKQAANYQHNLEASTKLTVVDKPVPTKTNVTTMLTAFERSKEEPKAEVAKDPRRSGRISALAKAQVDKMTTSLGSRSKASASKFRK